MLPRVGASLVRHHAVRRRHSPSPSSKSQPPSRRGTISGAHTDSYAIRSAPLSGLRRLKPIGSGQSSCGSQSTSCSVADVPEPAHLSTSSRSTINDFFAEKVSSVCRRVVQPFAGCWMLPRAYSRCHPSRRCGKNRDSTLLTPVLTDQFQTCQYCLNCWSVW